MSEGLSRAHEINGRSSRLFHAVGTKPLISRKPVTGRSAPLLPHDECGVWGACTSVDPSFYNMPFL